LPRDRLPKIGSFVALAAHPEYGVGRVVGVGPFTVRVLFVFGGLRVMRVRDAHDLVAAAPALGEITALVALEAGLVDLFDPGVRPRRPANDDVAVEQ
jgi:hypothetical protein